MNIFEIGESVDFAVPGIYIFENRGTPRESFGIGANVVGLVGGALWGEVGQIVRSDSARELIKYYGGESSELGRFISTMSKNGRYRFVTMRAEPGAGADEASVSLTAGAATTWDFEWEIPGALGNSTRVRINAGDIDDTVTVIFDLDGDKWQIRNVTNDPADDNYIGDVFNIPSMTFTKTGDVVTIPDASVDWVDFTGGADGAAASDANLLEAGREILQLNEVSDFAFTRRTTAALWAGFLEFAQEHMSLFYTSPEEIDVAEDFDDMIDEVRGKAVMRVHCAAGEALNFNHGTMSWDEVPIAWHISEVAKWDWTKSPLCNYIPYRMVQTWTKPQMRLMSNTHICYTGNDNGRTFLNETKMLNRDEYWSDTTVRRTFDTIERALARGLRNLIGLQGNLADRQREIKGSVTSLLSYLQGLGVMEGFEVDVSQMTSEGAALNTMRCRVLIEKSAPLRNLIIEVSRDASGTFEFSEEVI